MQPVLASLAFVVSFYLAAPSSAGGNSFHLTSCNLGCTDGAGGQTIACSLTSVPSNAALTFDWNADVDFSTVSAFTIQIVDVMTGLTPTGTYTLQNPRRVAFAPAGFTPGTTYQILIPGTAQGDFGPFVQSLSGQPNLTRLACAVTASAAVSSVVSECQTTPNSVGSGAVATWVGSSSLGLNDLRVTVAGLPAGRPAIPLASNASAQLPFGDGVLCVGDRVARLQPLGTGAGTLGFDVDWSALPAQIGATPGTTVRFQVLYRDSAGGPAGFNLSDAVAANLVP